MKFSVKKGFSLIEIILAVALFAVYTLMVSGSFAYGNNSTFLAGNRLRAIFLAEQALEIVRNIRDESFSKISSGDNELYLDVFGNHWGLKKIIGEPEKIDGIYTRKITISDYEGNVNIKKIVVEVSWDQISAKQQGKVYSETLLADNEIPIGSGGDAPTEITITTQVDWEKGTTDGNIDTLVVEGDGDIKLMPYSPTKPLKYKTPGTHTTLFSQIGTTEVSQYISFSAIEDKPKNTSVSYRFRLTNSDGSWTGDWTEPKTYSGSLIDLAILPQLVISDPNNSFLQVESKLSTSQNNKTPQVFDFTIKY
ncbi:MAG: hypothetical protein CEN89_711 [Candidatus Berkelbacteria bacterium Licking1014_7]|uniref:Prepilin-type N-terminal cleavage/methylation domain-containing protein n=1 Tax=Candidatus Berkelbacteria bacterium Licking1014_7 TaxID=2017147 RepID=A0A554LIH2_9BACT|nr:MAG: hypothetical protein CEN89_711 [Candidatus Berkelbacteria bacterium Licking1014_7]